MIILLFCFILVQFLRVESRPDSIFKIASHRKWSQSVLHHDIQYQLFVFFSRGWELLWDELTTLVDCGLVGCLDRSERSMGSIQRNFLWFLGWGSFFLRRGRRWRFPFRGFWIVHGGRKGICEIWEHNQHNQHHQHDCIVLGIFSPLNLGLRKIFLPKKYL